MDQSVEYRMVFFTKSAFCKEEISFCRHIMHRLRFYAKDSRHATSWLCFIFNCFMNIALYDSRDVVTFWFVVASVFHFSHCKPLWVMPYYTYYYNSFLWTFAISLKQREKRRYASGYVVIIELSFFV